MTGYIRNREPINMRDLPMSNAYLNQITADYQYQGRSRRYLCVSSGPNLETICPTTIREGNASTLTSCASSSRIRSGEFSRTTL